MLTVDKVPIEVKRAMRAEWARRNNNDAPEKHMADLAVAMLEAWPGMGIHPVPHWPGPNQEVVQVPSIILPLPPQEASDGQ